ncbi:unnamed protein product [Jaminaea pallidilutea]
MASVGPRTSSHGADEAERRFRGFHSAYALLQLQWSKQLRNVPASCTNACSAPINNIGVFAMTAITLEEHFLSHHLTDYQAANGRDEFTKKLPHAQVDVMSEVGPKRIASMDAGGVRIQVISHGPGEADLPTCQKINNDLADHCSRSPTRLAGFAMLPMSTPAEAAQELERCVKDLKFVGALIDNHLDDGTFYDAQRFWPVFARAEELDVPIYIHPSPAAADWMPQYGQGVLKEPAPMVLSIAGWGWHATTALHFLRLWCSGLFDAHPRLKIILGHMGEMLPYQIERTAKAAPQMAPHVRRDLMTVFRDNVWVTTSGMFTMPPFKCLWDVARHDHIMYSVDYPFSTNETGRQFLEHLRSSGLLSAAEYEAFEHGNAETLLRLQSSASSQ